MSELILSWPESGFSRFTLDAIWQTAIVAGLTWCCTRCLRRRPATRAWWIVLGVSLCLAAPLLTWGARLHGVGLLEPEARPASSTQSEVDRNAEPVAERSTMEPRYREGIGFPAAPYEITAGQPTPSEVELATRRSVERPRSVGESAERPSRWAMYLALLWGSATVLLACRLQASFVALLQVLRGARECQDEALLATFQDAVCALKLRTTPRLFVSDLVDCPAATACVRSCVVIPRRTPQDVDWFGVFCHELAHLRRADGWTCLWMEVSLMLFPWQPFLWLLRREHRRACEEACDDWALFAGADPLHYASVLTLWISRQPKGLAMSFASRRSAMRHRIERLVQMARPPRPHVSRYWSLGGGLAALLLLTVLPLLQHRPPRTVLAEETQASQQLRASQITGMRLGPGRLASGATPPTTSLQTIGEGRFMHAQRSRVLGFDASGKVFLSTSESLDPVHDNNVRFWQVASGEQMHCLPHAHRGLGLTPDRQSLLVGQADGRILVLDAQTGRPQHELKQLVTGRTRFVFSGDSQRVASVGIAPNASEQVKVWNLSSGETVATVDVPRIRGRHNLALSHDGQLLATTDNTSISLWEVETGKKRETLNPESWKPHHAVISLAFTRDGRSVISIGSRGHVEIWSADTFERRGGFKMNHGAKAVLLNDLGDTMATVDFREVVLSRVPSGETIWSFPLPRHATSGGQASLAFSPDGSMLAVAVHRHTLFLDSRTGRVVEANTTSGAEHTAIAIHPDGNRLAMGTSEGSIKIWDLATNHVALSWDSHDGAVRRLDFSPDGSLLASASDDRTVVLWNPSSGRAVQRLPERISIRPYFLGFSPDGKTLVSSCRGAVTNLWTTETGGLARTLAGTSGGLRGPVAFSPEGEKLFTVDSFGAVSLWDPASGNRLMTLAGVGPVSHLALSTDGKTLAAGRRNRLMTWDVDTRTEIGRYEVEHLNALAFCPRGELVVSVDAGTLQFLDAATGQCRRTLSIGEDYGAIRQIVFSPKDDRLFTLNANGSIGVLKRD